MSKKKRYPARKPRFAGGIRAQATRTSLRPWWARRWLAAIEPLSIAGRFARGREYAVSGQVAALETHGRETVARVVGTRSDPYEAQISFRAAPPEAAARIVAALRADPMLAARLFADDLPVEVEEIFFREGCPLFPSGRLPDGGFDMEFRCTCPDWAKPCKHAFAALFLLGEEVERRPFALLEFRGISQEAVCPEP